MTLEELWKRPIQIKWMPVHIQGPRIKDKFLRRELIMRLDEGLNGYGNVYHGYEELISRASNMSYFYFSYDITKKHIWTVEPENYEPINELRDEWAKWWGASPYSGNDSTIFDMNVFNDSYNGCFFNPKNGKVGYTHNLGKWVGEMSELKPEIEWFAKEFPEIELYLTFEDYPEAASTTTSSTDCWYTEPFATIHLKDGNIELVKTKKVKAMANPASHSKLYYFITNKFYFIWRKFFEVLNKEEYLYWHNYILFGHYQQPRIRIFDIDEYIAMIEWWQDVRTEYWKK